jgi:hypothetical protein
LRFLKSLVTALLQTPGARTAGRLKTCGTDDRRAEEHISHLSGKIITRIGAYGVPLAWDRATAKAGITGREQVLPGGIGATSHPPRE